MRRDMTKTQFDAACKRHGFRRELLGYYAIPGHPVAVCSVNGGPTYRERLAYLIRELMRHDEKAASAAGSGS